MTSEWQLAKAIEKIADAYEKESAAKCKSLAAQEKAWQMLEEVIEVYAPKLLRFFPAK